MATGEPRLGKTAEEGSISAESSSERAVRSKGDCLALPRLPRESIMDFRRRYDTTRRACSRFVKRLVSTVWDPQITHRVTLDIPAGLMQVIPIYRTVK